MADKTNLLKHYSARINIEKDKRLIESILITGVLAENRALATAMIADRGMQFMDLSGYKDGHGMQILGLTEEDSDGNAIEAITTRPIHHHPMHHHGHHQQQRPVRGRSLTVYKPFKCPIVTLCKETATGKLLGTSLSITKKEA